MKLLIMQFVEIQPQYIIKMYVQDLAARHRANGRQCNPDWPCKPTLVLGASVRFEFQFSNTSLTSLAELLSN
jgi:hypothetical protein